MRRRPLGVALLCVMCAAAPPVFADEGRGGSVRVAGDGLELVVALDGATPVEWRACHPSCAGADRGSGTDMRVVAADDPAAIRLIIRDLEPPVDLQRLRFSAELGEDERFRIATLAADLPVPGVRFVKSFSKTLGEWCRCAVPSSTALAPPRVVTGRAAHLLTYNASKFNGRLCP